MSKCVNEIVIDGVKYIPESKVRPLPESKVKIVVLQRGWVLVGYYRREGDNCFLDNASVIRQFGTTKGLGEIAIGGPTSATKLDPCNGLVDFHRLTEVLAINCEVNKWVNVLK